MQIRVSFFLFIWLFIPFQLVQSQPSYAWPNASTYNKNTDKYYISNYKGKNIISLDAAGNRVEVASGLTAPNNLLYANLPIGEGYIVLDSNTVKGYDSSWTYYASFTTTGAVKFQDAVFDDVNNALYISDVERGFIYKTTFGAAPFYFPSTSVFCTPFRRPSAMVWQKTKNRILYVEDTLGGNLMAVDLSTGNCSLVKALGMDNLVGLAEDPQGNLYLSSQGLKGIYQLNKYYAGSPVKLYSEPKPGDLLVNPLKDQWVYMCLICGSVFTPPLHLFGPGIELSGCPGDSFYCYKNYLHRNIGTFDNGNQFIMEMSNENGQFTSPRELARIKDTLIPATMNGKLPSGLKASSGYRVRWRSTKPAVTGSFETLDLYSNPAVSAAETDTVYACTGSSLSLGTKNPADTSVHYYWSPVSEVDSPNLYKVNLTANRQLKIKLLAINTSGCKTSDSVTIDTISSPDPGTWKDTLHACKSTAIQLGASVRGGLTYLWSPGQLLSDSTAAQPFFASGASQKFNLKLTGNGGCEGQFSQWVLVHENPKLQLLWDTAKLCAGDTLLQTLQTDAPHKTKWLAPSGPFSAKDQAKIGYGTPGVFNVTVTDSFWGCKTGADFIVIDKSRYFPVLKSNGDSVIQADLWLSALKWYRNDTLLNDTQHSIRITLDGNYQVCGTSPSGCPECSDPQFFYAPEPVNGLHSFGSSHFSFYPNPASHRIYFNGPVNYQIFNALGMEIAAGYGGEADLSVLPSGILLLKIKQNSFLLIHL